MVDVLDDGDESAEEEAERLDSMREALKSYPIRPRVLDASVCETCGGQMMCGIAVDRCNDCGWLRVSSGGAEVK